VKCFGTDFVVRSAKSPTFRIQAHTSNYTVFTIAYLLTRSKEIHTNRNIILLLDVGLIDQHQRFLLLVKNTNREQSIKAATGNNKDFPSVVF
jgi:hypothetical protein